MANKRDYYEVLGVDKSASEQDIKSAFRKLSRQYHPDMQAGKSDAEKKTAEEKFKEIAEAYEVLSDKDKRSKYDQFGFDGPNTFGSDGMDMADFMRRHAGMFSGMFGGNPFGNFGFDFNMSEQQQPQYDAPEDGRNVQVQVSIDFKSSITGCTKEFDLNLADECLECNGTGIEKGSIPEKCEMCHGTGMVTQHHGFMTMSSTCPACHGVGQHVKHCKKCNGNRRVQAKKHIKVKIPEGVDDGQKLRLKGSGECGVCGGSAGNLYIVVSVGKSELFERHGINLKTIQPISAITASLGGKIDVATPYGYCKVNIPAGSSSGKQIIVNGKGIKLNGTVGNLIVELKVEPISNLSDKQKELLEQLNAIMTDNNFPYVSAVKKKTDEYYK